MRASGFGSNVRPPEHGARLMPILRGSVTYSRYQLTQPARRPSDVKRWLLKGLSQNAFKELDRRSDEDRAAGFVELEDSEATGFSPSHLFYGERALFTWRIDQLKISAGALRSEMEKWKASFEKENGRRPARSEVNEHRAALRQMMRQQALPVTRTHDVALHPGSGELQIWSSSRKVVEEIALSLETGLEVQLRQVSPGARAQAQGVPEDALRPTAALLGVELQVPAEVEVAHGKA